MSGLTDRKVELQGSHYFHVLSVSKKIKAFSSVKPDTFSTQFDKDGRPELNFFVMEGMEGNS